MTPVAAALRAALKSVGDRDRADGYGAACRTYNVCSPRSAESLPP